MKIAALIIGLFAFIFFILSVQKKEKEKLLTFQLVANILYSIQYLLLNVKLAALMNFISVIRISVFYKYTKDKKPVPLYALIIFVDLILLVGFLGFDGNFISLIPIIITLLYTLSTYKNNMNVVRYVFMLCALIWMYYNYKVGAYTSLLGNVFEFSSALISIIRYKKSK